MRILLALLLLVPSTPDELRRKVEKAMKKDGILDSYDTLRRDMTRLDQRWLDRQNHPKLKSKTPVLKLIPELRADPLALPAATQRITRRQMQAGTFHERMAALAELLDVPVAEFKPPEPPAKGSSLEAHLDFLAARLTAANEARDKAFAKLNEAARKRLVRGTKDLLDVLRTTNHLEDLLPRDPNRYQELIDIMGMSAEIDYASMVRAAQELSPLASAAYLEQLRVDVRKAKGRVDEEGVTGTVVAVRDTKAGRIVVGGSGKNRYSTSPALILDIGGDDTYEGGCAQSENDVSIVLDLDGRDTYRAGKTAFSQGSAIAGVALLSDLRGNDTYEADESAQGAGFFGIGVLIDFQGKDTYKADTFSQGCGGFGIGLLLDHSGNDVLTGGHNCAGVGLPRGVGALVDFRGDDKRSVSGEHSNPPEGSWYGTKNRWHGAGLGHSFGLRQLDQPIKTLVPGGVGLVLDAGGDDEVTAGEFSIGCGYFYALGIYQDNSGDDKYTSARYGTGIGVHQALGCFIDLKGNDTYDTVAGPHCGASWDLGVGCFLDIEGNDKYTSTGGLLLGVGVISGFALFYDGDGKDEYRIKGASALGGAGHDGDRQRKTVSIGVFLDLGRDRDTYEAPAKLEAGNKTRKVREYDIKGTKTGRALFLDD